MYLAHILRASSVDVVVPACQEKSPELSELLRFQQLSRGARAREKYYAA
jgi:hypothetical protein